MFSYIFPTGLFKIPLMIPTHQLVYGYGAVYNDNNVCNYIECYVVSSYELKCRYNNKEFGVFYKTDDYNKSEIIIFKYDNFIIQKHLVYVDSLYYGKQREVIDFIYFIF